MITFFCYFRQFSSKKLALFSKIKVMKFFFHNLALSQVKTPIFADFFGGKKIKNSFLAFLFVVCVAK
jgi:hypothetical protein